MYSSSLSEYNCSLCSKPFEEKGEKLPRLLPDCGHTFCSQCIVHLLEKTAPNMPILCPEDQVQSSIINKEITSFPKNFALLKLLEKKKPVLAVNHKSIDQSVNEGSGSQKDEEQTTRTEKSIREISRYYLNEKNNNDEKNNNLEKSMKEPKETIMSRKSSEKSMKEYSTNNKMQDEVKPKKDTQDELKENKEESKETPAQQQQNYFSSTPVQPLPNVRICPEHHRKQEVVCIDHQTRICTNCALFGIHKNHNIKPEEDVNNEIIGRANTLITLFEEINNNLQHIGSEEFFNFYDGKIKEKELELYESINGKFEELISKIKAQQDKLITELHQKFEDLGDRFKVISAMKKDNEKIFSWQSSASKLLDRLDEKTKKEEIAFELLPNTSYPQIDIIKRGQEILDQQELSKSSTSKLLTDSLKGIKISLKENCFHFLDSFCKIDCSFPSEISKKWSESVSKAKPSSPSFFPPFKSHTLSLEEKISTKFEEKNLKPPSCADFLNDHDDENDLLSTELNFILTDCHEPCSQPILPNVHANKNSSDNSIVYSNNSHINLSNNNGHNGQNTSGFGNLTPIRSLNDIVVPGGNHNHNTSNNNLKVLTENTMNLQGRKPANLPSNEKQVRGNTPNTDRRLFTGGDIPNPTGCTNGSKLYKKKSKLVIGEKFEPVLEGLKKESLEIVDFTGAELGDTGLQSICEYIRNSKTMKTLKLLKNKITNDGILPLLKALSENTSLNSLNLSQNNLTDKVIDTFLAFFEKCPRVGPLTLIVNQNNINVRKANARVPEFKKLGINFSA